MKKKAVDGELEMQILAYFNGEFNKEDSLKFEEWIHASSENREIYDKLTNDYQKIAWATKEKSIDIVRGKEKFVQKVRKRTLRRKQYWSMAASIALLVAFACIYYFNYSHSQMNLKPDVVIACGSSKAKLVMASGEVVVLDDVKQIIQNMNGSIIKIPKVKENLQDTIIDKSTVNDKIAWNKIIVPKGGEFFVTLSDGTSIWLNADSELEYPVEFSGDSRNVRMKGEAYFKVSENQNCPFIVSAGEFSLKVYGTEFNLNTYNPDQIEAALISGCIGFKANEDSQELKLTPSQLGTANVKTGECHVEDRDLYPYIAWRHNEFVFVNERLESIMEKVARWYDVDVFFQNPNLKEICLYGNMKKYAEIQELLSFLEKASGVSFNIRGRTITVKRK